jgi:XTP/dITP diphosphohydrolase
MRAMRTKRLLIATSNADKVREFREMLGSEQFRWSDLSTQTHSVLPIEETGARFRANACLKAAYYAKQYGTWTLADDSGLVVDALDGKPGVHSARWAELNGAGRGLRRAQSSRDADNNALLLRQLKDVSDEGRAARFVCVLALADDEGRILLTAQNAVEGSIIREPRGRNGFGYDPLFLISELGKTTAELLPDEKHAISHRGKALRRLRTLMERAALL